MTGDPIEIWTVILGLAAATFAIRVSGAYLGGLIPTSGPWARALTALPGALIVALVSSALLRGGVAEWTAGAAALAAAVATRNLPIAMIAGVGTVLAMRALA